MTLDEVLMLLAVGLFLVAAVAEIQPDNDDSKAFMALGLAMFAAGVLAA